MRRTEEQLELFRAKQLRRINKKQWFDVHYGSNPRAVQRQTTWHRLGIIVGSPRDGRTLDSTTP